MKKIIQQLFSTASAKKSSKFSAWMDELDELDDIAALQLSTKQLSLALKHEDAQEAPSLQQQLDLILEIETLNHARLEKLSTQFSSVENMKIELENSICDTCYLYCRQSYIFHLKVIEKVFNNNILNFENPVKLEGDTPVILIARAFYAAINMIKWRLFSQANPPANVWLQIYSLYKIAAQKMLLNTPIELFDTTPSTTLAGYFVQTCMLGQLAQTTMQKYQVEIATRVIGTLLTRAHISNKYTPEQYLFYIDLEKDVAAKRMRDPQPTDSCRYWELSELEKQLTVAITVSDRGEIPESLAFSRIDHAKKLHDTLVIIYAEWKKTGYVRQRRRIERQATSKTAKVNAGIVDICNQVHQSNQINNGLRLSRTGSSLDERLRAHTVLRQTDSLSASSGTLDTWIVTDESRIGLGTRVNKYANILARPDKLIGLMLDDEPRQIIIGMIRSVKPTQGNQLRAGIEIISHHPVWVQLRQLHNNELFPSTHVEAQSLAHWTGNKPSSIDMGLFAGIYLPIEAGLSDASALILPKINYRPHSNYAVTVAGVAQNALLGDPIESHDDWVKVAFPF